MVFREYVIIVNLNQKVIKTLVIFNFSRGGNKVKTLVANSKRFLAFSAVILILFVSSIGIYAEGEQLTVETSNASITDETTIVLPEPTPKKGITMSGNTLNGSGNGTVVQDNNAKDDHLGEQAKNDKPQEIVEPNDSSTKPQEDVNDFKKTAFVIAALGAAGAAGGVVAVKKSNTNKASINSNSNLLGSLKEGLDTDKTYEGEIGFVQNNSISDYVTTLDGVVPDYNGVWVAQKDRENIIEEINSISAKKYMINDNGFIVVDKDQPLDISKSMTASKLVDSLINSDSQTIIGVNHKVNKYDGRTDTVRTDTVTDGITIGDKSTGHVVLVNQAVNSGITLFHELGHAAQGTDSAVQVENNIRKDLGMSARQGGYEEKEEQFYNNYGEGEGFLEEFAKGLGATVTIDDATETAYVDYKGLKGDFMNGIEGSYYDPASNKLLVKNKQFRYKLNLDISPGEVYLRSYVTQKGGQIEWIDTDRKAVISFEGKKLEIKLGEAGVKAINDRMVMTREAANSLLEIFDDGFSADDSSYDDSQGSASTTQGSESTTQGSASTTQGGTASTQGGTQNQSSANTTSKDGYSYNTSYDDQKFSDAGNLVDTFNTQEYAYNPGIDAKNVSSISGGESDDVGQLATLLSGGMMLKKSSRYLIAVNKNKKDIDSYKGFIEGLKEGIENLGFNLNEVVNDIKPGSVIYTGVRYLGKAAIVSGSEERKTLFSIVADDMEEISAIKNRDKVHSEAKRYGKTMVACLLSQITFSGLLGAVKSVATISQGDVDYNQKIEQMKTQADLGLRVQDYLKNSPQKLNEIVFKAEEYSENFILEMWDWEIKFIVSKSLIGPKQEAAILRFCSAA